MDAILGTFLNPVFPIFAVLLVGIIFSRYSLFDISAAQVINKFVFYVALPALIFNLLCDADFSRVDWRLPLIYFFAESFVFLLGTLVMLFVFRRTMAESILLGMTACFANHAFFVLPIATKLYGGQAALPITVLIVIDTTVVFGGVITGLEIAKHREASYLKIAKRLISNPVLASILIGILVNMSEIQAHDGINTYTTFVGNAAPPASLFSLGIVLATTCRRPPGVDTLCIGGLKIIAFPLVVWGLTDTFTAFDPVFKDTLVMTAAGPCGAMPFVIAMQYHIRSQTISQAILYSTIASLCTLPIIA